MPNLRIRTADGPEKVHELEGEVVLGRGDDVSLQLLDPKISRRHCRVYAQTGVWLVEDVGSSNGTKVNGTPRKRHQLKAGDRIEIGRTVAVFEVPAAKKYAAPVRRTARERMADKRGK